jgi:hypothetical protein
MTPSTASGAGHDDEPSPPVEPPARPAPLAGRPTVEDMGEWSFPASDPPATWTWEVTGGSSG